MLSFRSGIPAVCGQLLYGSTRSCLLTAVLLTAVVSPQFAANFFVVALAHCGDPHGRNQLLCGCRVSSDTPAVYGIRYNGIPFLLSAGATGQSIAHFWDAEAFSCRRSCSYVAVCVVVLLRFCCFSGTLSLRAGVEVHQAGLVPWSICHLTSP